MLQFKIEKDPKARICLIVFGKRHGELDTAELKQFNQYSRMVSYYRNYQDSRERQRLYASERKLRIIRAMGWEPVCSRCGYSKSLAALDFHHLDPSKKDGLVKSVKEARKCVLICANCHREEHEHQNRNGKGRPRNNDPMLNLFLTAHGITLPGR